MQRCEVVVVGAGPVGSTLSDELAGHRIDVRTIREPDRLIEVAQDESGVFATLSGDDQARSDYLVGTDEAIQSVRDQLRTDEVFRSDRVFLAGDGGIGDAYNLAWKLAAAVRGASDELLLDSYAEERQQVIEGTPTSLRDRLTRLVRTNQPTEPHYRECRLSQHFGGKAQLIRAGDPVPDVRLWHIEDGAERSLSELRGRRWTVLGLGSMSAATVKAVVERFGTAVHGEVVGGGTGLSGVPGVTVVDRRGEARQRLAKRGGTVLVIRPDGYVGMVGMIGRLRSDIVQAYLEDLIPPDSDYRD